MPLISRPNAAQACRGPALELVAQHEAVCRSEAQPTRLTDQQVDDAITTARSAYYPATRDDILKNFAGSHPTGLSAAQAIRLAKAAYYPNTRDKILRMVVQ